jgi:hypothetical protein
LLAICFCAALRTRAPSARDRPPPRSRCCCSRAASVPPVSAACTSRSSLRRPISHPGSRRLQFSKGSVARHCFSLLWLFFPFVFDGWVSSLPLFCVSGGVRVCNRHPCDSKYLHFDFFGFFFGGVFRVFVFLVV